MKKASLRVLLVFCSISALVISATAAPIVTLESAVIAPGTTSFDLDVSISTSASFPIDSAAFTLSLPTGVSFTSTQFAALPTGWNPTSNTTTKKFGATDFGFPANPIIADQLFATLFFSVDLAVTGNSFLIGLTSPELADSDGAVYNPASYTVNPGRVDVVPIPAAVWLLGSGVVGLVALKRRKKA